MLVTHFAPSLARISQGSINSQKVGDLHMRKILPPYSTHPLISQPPTNMANRENVALWRELGTVLIFNAFRVLL